VDFDDDPAVLHRGRGTRLERPRPAFAWLGWGEAIIVVVYFVCAIMYVRPYKKAAKKMAKELLDKVKENTVP
jgi:hypothetical protein